jgi:hypothetical protein
LSGRASKAADKAGKRQKLIELNQVSVLMYNIIVDGVTNSTRS